MSIMRNPVQMFIRNIIRLVVAIPLWLLIALPNFRNLWEYGTEGQLLIGGVKTLIILWIANIIAKMFFVLPQWERLVLLRLGKSVGTRGPARPGGTGRRIEAGTPGPR